jgi:hypothetical protein
VVVEEEDARLVVAEDSMAAVVAMAVADTGKFSPSVI